MKNKDAAYEVRDLLFHLNKAYAKLEDDTHIVNNGEFDMHTFQYLEKVTELFETFYGISINLRKDYIRLFCSEN